MVDSRDPSATFHRCTVPSSADAASVEPSGLNDIDRPMRDRGLWSIYHYGVPAKASYEMYELRPTEPADGDHFVTRETPTHPWVPVTFTPSHVFTSGRVTPRV